MHSLTAHPILFTEIIFAIIIIVASGLFSKKQRPPSAAQEITQKKCDTPQKAPIVITSQDIKAIAGDDVITTQLDLARAYIEIGRKRLAKKILDHVTQHGNANQQQVAKQLMANL